MRQRKVIKKSWNSIKKILSGQKKIISKWYQVENNTWDGRLPRGTIYFKDCNSPVTIKSEVEKVILHFDLSPDKIENILIEYGQLDGLGIDNVPKFFERNKEKKCCALIFLKNSQWVNG